MAKERRVSLFYKILGYHTIVIPRLLFEQFLDLCMRYGFSYLSIRVDEEKRQVHINVPSYQFKRIMTACRVWQIRAKVVGAKGLPSRILSLKGRWGLIAGACVSIALFCLAQSVIWRVDVVGNKRLSSDEVIETLSEHGMSVGDFIKRLNTDSIEQKVMINNDDIAWISINIVGTVAHVEVKEVIDTEIKEKETKPANLVSLFDAQIVSLEVYSGFPCVKEGDFVRAGELLASGIHNSEKAPLRYSRAFGSVYGRLTHTFEIEIPLLQTKKVPTGETISKKSLIFFGKTINFFSNYRNLPTSYDIINYVYTFDPFSLGELPISLSVNEYYGYELLEVEISEEEAMQMAYDELRKRIDEELPEAQILKKSLYGEIVDGKYVLRCTVTAICNIAKQVEFEVRS